MLEKSVENDIKDELKKRNAWFLKHAAGPNMPKGIPDILVCYGGFFIGFENKRTKNPSSIKYVQKQNLDLITKNNGIGVVCLSKEFAVKVLDAVDNHDLEALTNLGWKSHGKKEMCDVNWLEETIW